MDKITQKILSSTKKEVHFQVKKIQKEEIKEIEGDSKIASEKDNN